MVQIGFDSVRAAVRSHLTPRSAAHCEAVAEECVRLAGVYGVDVDSARLAGLLHDWARDEDDATLIARATALDIEVGPHDHGVPYLLHAEVGAKQVAREFPDLGDEILAAIARHTTGAVEMSDLDRIVYVADMIEPRRSFDGVEGLRASVGAVPLDELFALAYEVSLRHLIERRHRFHPVTIEVWNALVAGGRP